MKIVGELMGALVLIVVLCAVVVIDAIRDYDDAMFHE